MSGNITNCRQLSLFDFVPDVKVPDSIYDGWQENKDRCPTITSYIDLIIENIERWQLEHPDWYFFDMWNQGREYDEWSRYLISIMNNN